MNALLLGGTGLISQGIVKHLLARGASVTIYNRNQRQNPFGPNVKTIAGDRNDLPAFESTFADQTYDVAIDMIAFSPKQAESDVRAFAGRCKHFLFCSTVCTYGVKVPPNVLIDESFPQEPISDYGRNKVACEKIIFAAHDAKKFAATIIRPSCTYGPSGHLIDNLEFNPPTWDRIARGLPVLCSDGGLGLWQATHRDDVGKLFAYAALNPKTFGQAYNATRDTVFTWRDYYRQAAAAIGQPAKLLFMPANWIVQHDPQRFGLLREITQFHGAYTSAKAKRDVPEFDSPKIEFTPGAAETLADLRRRNAWRSTDGDSLYQSMIDRTLALGVAPVEA